MVKFIRISEASAEEYQAKESVNTSDISIIKYLDIASVSFRFAVSAHVVYMVCSHSLQIGVSFIRPCFFVIVDI